jgi:3-oxoadipate enol-lactonase
MPRLKKGTVMLFDWVLFGERVAATLLAATLMVGVTLADDSSDTLTDKLTNGYLDVSGSKVYYEEAGSGRAIVLLHDGLLHSITWDAVWQPLAARYHVVRYDRRGYGRSELPTVSYSSTQDLVKLLTHLKVQHAVVVGSSSGGALAIDFAIEHPEMVDGLFLIGPVLHGMQYTHDFLERSRRNSEPLQRDDIEGMARNWSQDRFLIASASERARRKIYEELVANSEKVKSDNPFEEELSLPASKRLSEIKAPTVILVGEADIADVHAHCDGINAGIRASRRVVVQDAGHLIQLEKPDEVVHGLQDFIDYLQTRHR